MRKVKLTCPVCKSDAVLADAYARWDVDKQDWVLGPVFDAVDCNHCGAKDIHPDEEVIADE